MNPEGKYRARITAPPRFGTNSKENPELVYPIELIAKYEGSELYELPPGCQPRRTIWAVITDKTAERRASELQVIDPSVTDFSDVDPQAAEPGKYCDITGKEVDVTCKWDSWNGQTRDKYEFDMRGFVPKEKDKAPTASKSLIQQVKRRFGALFGKKAEEKPPF